MTLELYSPERLDALAWRVFDLAASVRRLARESRGHGLEGVLLHDKKTLEYLAKLEDWAARTEAELGVKAIKQRAVRDALARTGAAKKTESSAGFRADRKGD